MEAERLVTCWYEELQQHNFKAQQKGNTVNYAETLSCRPAPRKREVLQWKAYT